MARYDVLRGKSKRGGGGMSFQSSPEQNSIYGRGIGGKLERGEKGDTHWNASFKKGKKAKSKGNYIRLANSLNILRERWREV